jgi:hypothetical protein
MCIGKQLLIIVLIIRTGIFRSVSPLLRARRWITWSSIPYSGHRLFSSSKLSDRIWDALSSKDSGNTCIDVHLVVWEATNCNKFTVEIKSAWRLTTTTNSGVTICCYIKQRKYFVVRITQIIRMQRAECRLPNVRHPIYQNGVYHFDWRTLTMWVWIN